MKTRQLTPDWLKGIAIVLMVYGHINHVWSLASLQKQIVSLIYTFHIPIFLMISGFFFNITAHSGVEGLKTLSKRLVLPYVIFLSVYLISLILIQKIGIPTINAPPRSIPDFIQIILLHPRGAYWFLHSLILIQLCFMFAKALTLRTKWDDTVFFSLSFSLLAMACHYHLCSQRVALYFLLGVILRRFGNVLPASLKSGSLLIVIILIFTGEEIFKPSFIQFAWCLAMLAFLAGLGQAMESSPVVSLFAWLGRNSLIVLVVHAMFVVSLKPSVTLFLKLDQTGLLYSTAVVVITMSGCVLSAFLLDRTRISQHLFGVDKIYSDLKLNTLKKPA